MSKSGDIQSRRFASNLDAAIADSGKTNREVGEEVGTTEHQVWRWRKGRTMPSAPYVVELARVLGHDVAWFFEEPHGTPDHPHGRRAA